MAAQMGEIPPTSLVSPAAPDRDTNMANQTQPSRHILVFAAFVLAVLLFVFPTYADLMFAARDPLDMGVATLVCFGIVLIPLVIGSALTRRQPQRWRKSRLATATWLILALWFLLSAFGWCRVFAEG